MVLQTDNKPHKTSLNRENILNCNRRGDDDATVADKRRLSRRRWIQGRKAPFIYPSRLTASKETPVDAREWYDVC